MQGWQSLNNSSAAFIGLYGEERCNDASLFLIRVGYKRAKASQFSHFLYMSWDQFQVSNHASLKPTSIYLKF